jgi:hypothetical protein
MSAVNVDVFPRPALRLSLGFFKSAYLGLIILYNNLFELQWEQIYCKLY